MVFHGDLSGHQGLTDGATQAFRQGGSGHGRRNPDLRLTATHSCGNRRSFFENAADLSGRQQEFHNVVFFDLYFRKTDIVEQHRRNDSRRTVGRGRYHAAETGIFFVDGHRKTADPFDDLLELVGAGSQQGNKFLGIIVGRYAQQRLPDTGGPATYSEASGELSLFVASGIHAVPHHFPDPQQPLFDLGSFAPALFVGQHDLPDIGVFVQAVPPQFGGSGNGVGEFHRRFFTDGFAFFDHKTAPHRKVRIGMQ